MIVATELVDFHWTGAVHVEVNSAPPYMKVSVLRPVGGVAEQCVQLSTGGSIGMSEVLLPRASDAFISFRCQASVSACYSLKALLLGMKVG